MEFEVGTDWEYLCFCVQMLDICVCGAACDDSECSVSGGEFDWGGTSVKRRCPKMSSARTEPRVEQKLT